MNWITPLIIALANECQDDISILIPNLMRALRFIGDFGFPCPLTGVHFNIFHIGAFDYKMWAVLDGGQTSLQEFNLRKSLYRKKEQYNFSEFLSPNADSGGRRRRAAKFNSPKARNDHADDNKGQKLLCIFESCLLIIFTEEEHEGFGV
eukprot:196010_1